MKKALLALTVAALALGFGAAAQAADISPAGLCSTAETLSVPAGGLDLGEVVNVEKVFDPENPDRVTGEIIQMSGGCQATANCFHGGQVSCSTPYGTCTVSYAQCGWVQCGEQPAVRCPGSCGWEIHCYYFCGQDENAICAWDKCCECST